MAATPPRTPQQTLPALEGSVQNGVASAAAAAAADAPNSIASSTASAQAAEPVREALDLSLRAGCLSDEALSGAEDSDGAVSDAERSDVSEESSCGVSEASDEELVPPPCQEISSLAAVVAADERTPASASSTLPASATATGRCLVGSDSPVCDTAPALSPSSPSSKDPTYPAENLPPHAGLSVAMMENSPIFNRAVPPVPEPFYTAPETLFDDIVRQEADRISHPENVRNRVVYDSVEAPVTVPTTPAESDRRQRLEPCPSYTLSGPDDTTLIFESRFESGNLRRAVQVYEFEYDLLLNPDYNTKVHTQWYLFRVSNTRKGPSYRFNIINMVKPTSVYNEGMRPLLYSSKDASERGAGWARGGENIAYYQNGIRRKERNVGGDKGTNYYTLTFTISFQRHDDTVYFTHCYPYTYTDLQKDLQELEADPAVSRLFRRRKLCDTLAGNACDLLTITSFNSDPAALRARRAVVITARVHPGESNASWIMKGMLDYLTGTSLDARILRDNFVFKIVPMLNPDGCIVGNYRCSLAGTDLNRQWDDPSRKMHPTIFFAKNMMRHLMNDRDVILYIDIHGHSRKKNVFMYGNSEGHGIREKIFPRLLSKSSDCFNFDDCCFKIQKSKESTARVVAYQELGIPNAYTLEASFCGADFGALAEQHFTIRHLEEMGYMVCDAILDFCDPDQSKVMVIYKELQLLFPDDGNSDDVSDSAEDDDDRKGRRRRKSKKHKHKDKDKAKKKQRQHRKRELQEERESQARLAQEQRERVMQELIAEGLAVGDGSVPARELTEPERRRLEWRANTQSRDSQERGWGSADAAAVCPDNDRPAGARRSPLTAQLQAQLESNSTASEPRGRRSHSNTKKKSQPQQRKDKAPHSAAAAPRGRYGSEAPSAAAAVAHATASIAASASARAEHTPGGSQGSRSSTEPQVKEKPRKGYEAAPSEPAPPVPVVATPPSRRSSSGPVVSQWSFAPDALSPKAEAGSHSQSEGGPSEAPRNAAVFPPLSNSRRPRYSSG